MPIPPPAFRLPDAARLGGVQLQVSDLQRSIDYYERVIGLRLAERGDGSAWLRANGDGPPLVYLRENKGVARVPRRGAFGLYHFAILLPDRPSLGRFVSHLAALGLRLGAADHLVSEAIYLTDPDGLGIEVYADRPRSAWQARGQELVMATEPLDLESLAEAGAGTAWEGAPAGTILGHIHLHVGDLEQSEAFYHRAFGFDKTVWGYPGALFLSAGGYHHHLATNTWSPGPSATDEQARLLVWEVILPGPGDVEAAASSLRAAGYSPDVADNGFIVADPWGTRVRVTS